MNVTELPVPEKEVSKPVARQVEILIHTRNPLDESAAEHVIQKLGHVTGVSEACYNSTRNHLLMVSYNPRAIEPVQLLTVMQELGYEAQLIGL